MVKKSVTVALTLGILLGLASPSLSRSPGPVILTHPWQDSTIGAAPSGYDAGSVSGLGSFVPVAVLINYALQLNLGYVVKQDSCAEIRTLSHKRDSRLLSQNMRDRDSVNQNNRYRTR